MRKPVIAILALLLGTSVLVGCGSSSSGGSKSSSSGYCATLKSSKDQIKSFNSNDVPSTADFEAFIKKIGTLSDEAPAKIAADWKTLNGLLVKLKDALDEAGVTLEQLGEASSTGKLPDGIDPAKAMKLASTMSALTSDKSFDEATKAIKDDAKDTCDLTIDIS